MIMVKTNGSMLCGLSELSTGRLQTLSNLITKELDGRRDDLRHQALVKNLVRVPWQDQGFPASTVKRFAGGLWRDRRQAGYTAYAKTKNGIIWKYSRLTNSWDKE